MAGAAASTVVSVGVSAATLPLRVGVDLVMGSGAVDSMAAVARELVGGTPSRRCWQGAGRAWVEVRGLGGPSGPVVGGAVLEVLRAQPGVRHRRGERSVVAGGGLTVRRRPDPARVVRSGRRRGVPRARRPVSGTGGGSARRRRRGAESAGGGERQRNRAVRGAGRAGGRDCLHFRACSPRRSRSWTINPGCAASSKTWWGRWPRTPSSA